jgi:hypothetical protein
MRLGDLAQALAPSALLENSNTIDIKWPPADMPSLQPGAAHSCPHPSMMRFRSSSAIAPMMMTTARPSGPPVSRFSRKLTNSMLRWLSSSSTSRKWRTDRAIRSEAPDQEHLEVAAVRISKQIVKTRPASFRPRDSIGVLGNDLKTPLLGHRAEIIALSLRVLVDTGYAQIKGNSFHICSPIESTASRKKLDSRSS